MSKSVIASNRDTFQAIYPNNPQRLSVGAASVASSAFSANSTIIKLFPTTDCWVIFAGSPTAAVNDGNSFFLPSGIVEYFGIQQGQKIAVIRDSANGYLHITEGHY